MVIVVEITRASLFETSWVYTLPLPALPLVIVFVNFLFVFFFLLGETSLVPCSNEHQKFRASLAISAGLHSFILVAFSLASNVIPHFCLALQLLLLWLCRSLATTHSFLFNIYGFGVLSFRPDVFWPNTLLEDED